MYTGDLIQVKEATGKALRFMNQILYHAPQACITVSCGRQPYDQSVHLHVMSDDHTTHEHKADSVIVPKDMNRTNAARLLMLEINNHVLAAAHLSVVSLNQGKNSWSLSVAKVP